jgi:hypothetical protein
MNKRPPKGKNAKERKVKLFFRLNAEVNDGLRALTRYHGDLSRYIDEALCSADLRSLAVEEVRAARNVPGLTAVVSRDVAARLRVAARERGCSITALANRAVESWLAKRSV